MIMGKVAYVNIFPPNNMLYILDVQIIVPELTLWSIVA